MTHAHQLPPDPIRDAGFPTVEQLRRGIVLDCIVHSFWLITHDPIFYMIWEGDTYHEDTIEGEHWAVSFPPGGAVAVFYSDESARNPFPDGSPPYDQSWFFRGLPRHLEPARDRALSTMHDLDFGFGNTTKAVITAAMWADGERFTAVEPWDQVYHHSCWACRPHLLPPEEALHMVVAGHRLPGVAEGGSVVALRAAGRVHGPHNPSRARGVAGVLGGRRRRPGQGMACRRYAGRCGDHA